MPPPGSNKLWEDKIHRSGYFIGAVLLHLVVFLLVATFVIWPATSQPPDQPFKAVPKSVVEKAEVQVELVKQTPVVTPPVDPAASQSAASIPIITGSASPFHIAENIPTPGSSAWESGASTSFEPKRVVTTDGMSLERQKEVRDFVLAHQKLVDIQEGTLKAKFPVYVASYADGDWACNTGLDQNGNIVTGSIPNLAAKISQWSHGDVEAQVMPKPLNIGGPELLATKPPFIFFTGHKDFRLTDQEVANLQQYVFKGGLIWGDNALAGRGSRFDVAFRREMQRVIPDLDKKFEAMPMDSDLFARKKNQLFSITQLPQGMNYYSEPILHVDMDGIPAILYTVNDYSDLMDMRILADDTTPQLPYADMPPKTLYTNVEFWSHQHVFYRNFAVESSLAVQKLGSNIVTYLLTRFDDKLILNP